MQLHEAQEFVKREASLPNEPFRKLKTFLQSRKKEIKKLEKLGTKMRDICKSRREKPEVKKVKRAGGPNGIQAKDRRKCFNCDEKGHIQRNCPFSRHNKSGKSEKQRKDEKTRGGGKGAGIGRQGKVNHNTIGIEAFKENHQDISSNSYCSNNCQRCKSAADLHMPFVDCKKQGNDLDHFVGHCIVSSI